VSRDPLNIHRAAAKRETRRYARIPTAPILQFAYSSSHSRTAGRPSDSRPRLKPQPAPILLFAYSRSHSWTASSPSTTKKGLARFAPGPVPFWVRYGLWRSHRQRQVDLAALAQHRGADRSAFGGLAGRELGGLDAEGAVDDCFAAGDNPSVFVQKEARTGGARAAFSNALHFWVDGGRLKFL
jgi:hypothetical protein